MTISRGLVVLLLLVVVPATLVRAAGLDRAFPLATIMTVYPYVVVGAAVATVGATLVRAVPETMVGGATLAIGLALLLPRVSPGPSPGEAPTGPQVVIAVANLREGNGDAVTVVEAVHREAIDVLVALEVTERSVDAFEQAGLGRRLPHASVLPSRLSSGGGIWSRHPLRPRKPSRQRGYGATPSATIEVPGHGPLDIDAVHPLPPINRAWTRSWEQTLRSLPPPPAAAGDGPRRLLAGDFNATIDHRWFRALLDLGWVDAAAARGAGLRPTFSGLGAGEPVPPVTLDHVLVDADVLVEHVTTRLLPGSDHRMLIVRMRLPTERPVR